MIELIKDKKQWHALLEKVENSDCYHTYAYHKLSKKDDEEPILIKYTQSGTCLLLPLLLRHIGDSGYKDATSVYGYSGILSITIAPDFDRTRFQSELLNYLRRHRIISVFSRLHPYIDHQEYLLTGLGTICTPGNVVYIDLKEPLEVQRQGYSKRLKTYINKSRKLCTIISGKSEKHLQTFMRLYYANMKRVNAHEDYFFSEEYFLNLMNCRGCETELLLCLDNVTNTPIAGAIFIKTKHIVQYHLSGLNEEYSAMNPVKVLLDEIRIKATKEGYSHFNLGGGKGSNEDSLFYFKYSFSKRLKPFKIWKCIVDEKIYRTLVTEHIKSQEAFLEADINYFPAYRHKVQLSQKY